MGTPDGNTGVAVKVVAGLIVLLSLAKPSYGIPVLLALFLTYGMLRDTQ